MYIYTWHTLHITHDKCVCFMSHVSCLEDYLEFWREASVSCTLCSCSYFQMSLFSPLLLLLLLLLILHVHFLSFSSKISWVVPKSRFQIPDRVVSSNAIYWLLHAMNFFSFYAILSTFSILFYSILYLMCTYFDVTWDVVLCVVCIVYFVKKEIEGVGFFFT